MWPNQCLCGGKTSGAWTFQQRSTRRRLNRKKGSVIIETVDLGFAAMWDLRGVSADDRAGIRPSSRSELDIPGKARMFSHLHLITMCFRRYFHAASMQAHRAPMTIQSGTRFPTNSVDEALIYFEARALESHFLGLSTWLWGDWHSTCTVCKPS